MNIKEIQVNGLIIILILFLLNFIRYGWTLKLGFKDDDYEILEGGQYSLTRAIPFFLINGIKSIFGAKPFYFHFANLMMNFISTMSILLLARIIFHNYFVSFSASLFFLLFPSQIYMVSWVTSIKEFLALFFILTSLTFFYYFIKDRFRLFFYLLSFAGFAGGLFCKEHSIIIIPFITGLWFYYWRERGYRIQELIYILPYLATFAFLIYEFALMGRFAFHLVDSESLKVKWFILKNHNLRILPKVLSLIFTIFLSDTGILKLLKKEDALVERANLFNVLLIYAVLFFVIRMVRAGRIRMIILSGLSWIFFYSLVIALAPQMNWWDMELRHYTPAVAFALFLSIPLHKLINLKNGDNVALNGDKKIRPSIIAGCGYFVAVIICLWINKPVNKELFISREIYRGIPLKDVIRAFGEPKAKVAMENRVLWLYPGLMFILNSNEDEILDMVFNFLFPGNGMRYFRGLSMEFLNLLINPPEKIEVLERKFSECEKVEKAFYRIKDHPYVVVFCDGKFYSDVVAENKFQGLNLYLFEKGMSDETILLMKGEPDQIISFTLPDGTSGEKWIYLLSYERAGFVFHNHQLVKTFWFYKDQPLPEVY